MGSRPLRILILTFYYRPDLSAGSFRVTALVEALRRVVPRDSRIDVVTTLPNRYRSFSAEAPQQEEFAGGSVWRIPLPLHQSGMADQSKAFIAFARGVLNRLKRQRYDLVFASSSRLMTALLATEVARRTGARLYLDIRDIFADTIKDVLKGLSAQVAWSVFSRMEGIALRRAAKVSLVSGGFLPYFTERYPAQHFECFTNGVDDEFLTAAPEAARPSPHRRGPERVTVLYAGNIGEGQGLHTIIPQLAGRLGQAVHFEIVGDGGRRRALEESIASQGVSNVTLHPPVSRDQLIAAYQAADVLFLHLNDYPAFEKVLPSKIFEYAAMGKPVWAGVAGFSARFISEEISNSAVFAPGNLGQAIESFRTLQMVDQPRIGFVARFGRSAIANRLAEDLVATARRASGR